MTEPTPEPESVEDEWAATAKAARRASLRAGARLWISVLGSGAVGALTLVGTLGTWDYWPLEIRHLDVHGMPLALLVILGIPLLVGVAAHVTLIKLLGGSD